MHVRTNPRIDEILFEERSHKRIIFQAFSREECTVNRITTRLWFIFVTEYDSPGSAFDAYTLDSRDGSCTIRADDNVRTIFLPRITDHAWFVVISLNADSHANIGSHPLSMVKHDHMIIPEIQSLAQSFEVPPMSDHTGSCLVIYAGGLGQDHLTGVPVLENHFIRFARYGGHVVA
jgi:hypothetical protein